MNAVGGNPQKRKYTQFGHHSFLLDISTWTIEHGGVLLSALDLITDLGFDNVLWNENFLHAMKKDISVGLREVALNCGYLVPGLISSWVPV